MTQRRTRLQSSLLCNGRGRAARPLAVGEAAGRSMTLVDKGARRQRVRRRERSRGAAARRPLRTRPQGGRRGVDANDAVGRRCRLFRKRGRGGTSVGERSVDGAEVATVDEAAGRTLAPLPYAQTAGQPPAPPPVCDAKVSLRRRRQRPCRRVVRSRCSCEVSRVPYRCCGKASFGRKGRPRER